MADQAQVSGEHKWLAVTLTIIPWLLVAAAWLVINLATPVSADKSRWDTEDQFALGASVTAWFLAAIALVISFLVLHRKSRWVCVSLNAVMLVVPVAFVAWLSWVVMSGNGTVRSNSALLTDAFSSLRFACGAAKRER